MNGGRSRLDGEFRGSGLKVNVAQPQIQVKGWQVACAVCCPETSRLHYPSEAESKLGISKSQILEWVEEGIVRSEDTKGKVKRVNLDDLEIKLAEITRI